jgi:hypothetical protein
MVISIKNLKKIAGLLCIEVVLIGIVVYTITTSFFNQESFIVKNSQIDDMYENWLILRTSVFSYITSPSPGRTAEQEKLVRDFEVFDFSMVQISDDHTFDKIERQYPQVRDFRQVLVYNWQNVQYKLTELLQAGEFYGQELPGRQHVRKLAYTQDIGILLCDISFPRPYGRAGETYQGF